ncbi:Nitrogen assimilation transcription factor nit-like protein [Emericellopsis cladophorae]|uniref:Nitrogen assimilation transcription factor nit-like protein n=1 Tax=Emericellopsis cladophorae TaxID=2686198 RepID=A0A9P9Y2L8_9HYPO|nr:Nitrogen assimilation transcription factor nit-like protein [Emericellopsis cladophorae]KAI6782352.1 Nitrogen assimilation transcription factor nit-like protein [Emericellopsis cladophorae]
MSTSAKATKKSAFSCEPCRRRKVKCGGEQPVCNRCASRRDECVYKLNPTLSYTQRLEQRIKELEDQLAGHHLSGRSRSPISTHPSSSHSSPPSFSSHDAPSSSRVPGDELGVQRRFRGLKVDDKGGVIYQGATSFFHLPNDRTGGGAGNRFLPLTEVDVQRRERLVTNAWQQRALENLSEIPEPFQYLLNVHWCWIQPLFNFVYRPAFTRDMQTLGPYYSHTLLNAMLSHSIRWGKSDPATRQLLDESYEGGVVFGKHARALVFEELSNGIVTVPTIQTLLLLSAQECGFGNATQAWTYSGLAFRLIDHLGICVDGTQVLNTSMSDEEAEIRRRLFWSCYFWDKMISLYLGRAPSMQHSAVSPPHVMFDDSAENDPWTPFGMQAGPAYSYPPTPAHSASCFTSMCQLSVIFNQILVHMYDPMSQNTEEEVDDCVRTQEAALQQWWDMLPPFLRLDATSLPAMAPPSHIVTLNCLYHTFRILLYRPVLTRVNKDAENPAPIQKYLIDCVTSATSIIAIFNLFCKTFSTNYCVLSLSYSVYIAATIYLLQVQAFPNDHQALQRLDYCIRGLNEVKRYSPIIGGALNLINKELASLGISLKSSAYMTPDPTSAVPEGPAQSPFYAAHRSNSFHGIPLTNSPTPSTDLGPQQHRGFDTFGPSDTTAMEPGMYEAMSSLEPLSAWVGTIHNFDPA